MSVRSGAPAGAGRPCRTAGPAEVPRLQPTDDDLDAVEQAVPRGAVAGKRSPPALPVLPGGERTGGEH
ncbi:hypothetical protein [Planomonospora alba]|uniref:hypothetical protein n=1 Tax=Planomonospora alba TaxID=161354 RepID=UPI0031E7942E